MTIKPGWVEAFHDDELVVALPDLPIVRKALGQYGVRVGRVTANQVLGLARLTGLAGVEHAAANLRRDLGEPLEKYCAERRETHPAAPPLSELAQLIKGIRLLFAREYPGWQVTIGKNYHPSVVKGFPHIGGGEGEPTPTDGAFTPPVDPGPDRANRGRGVEVGLADTALFRHKLLDGHYSMEGDHELLPDDWHQFTEFDGHSAFVASCILQQAPRAGLSLRHVLDRQGDGSAWDVAVGLAELVPLGLDVVNLSLGEFMTDDDSAPMVLDAAVRRFSRDTVLVAAAGNNGDTTDPPAEGVPPGVTARTTSYPAGLPDVVGVGALEPSGELAPFTPRDMPWISLLARGADVNGAYVDGEVLLTGPGRPAPRRVRFNGTANWAGCSFAAGVVSGVIAARTEPGHRSAREALDTLIQSLAARPRQGLLLNPAGH
jgi:hypothetical protein